MALKKILIIIAVVAVGAAASFGWGWNYRHKRHHFPPPPVTTTTLPATTTTRPPPATTTTQPPVTTTTGLGLRRCFGTALTNGQSDLNAGSTNQVFCLSGTHTGWTLSPKSGQQIISDPFNPGILDGQNSTQYALTGSGTGVVLDGVEIKNYTTASQQAAIEATGSGWLLRNLQVHDNGTSSGGAGSKLGTSWQIVGGRYYNNRQSGIAGDGTNSTVDGVEIDHNNFTNNSYTTANVNCDNEAGGMKFVTSGLTIKNSSVHDNACRGIWADINATNITITNNHVYNNWADGIMFEISRSATITGNTVSGNGFKEFSGGSGSCSNGYGAGIFISTSGRTDSGDGTITVSGNTVTGNCSGITGVDEGRTDSGFCTGTCELLNLTVTSNTVTSSADSRAHNYFGAFPNAGNNLATHNLSFSGNTLSGMNNCGLTCTSSS